MYLLLKKKKCQIATLLDIEYPNPEEKKALTIGIEIAKKDGADLIIGN